jgi:hypothetical protein
MRVLEIRNMERNAKGRTQNTRLKKRMLHGIKLKGMGI